jgi:hypothetical protein
MRTMVFLVSVALTLAGFTACAGTPRGPLASGSGSSSDARSSVSRPVAEVGFRHGPPEIIRGSMLPTAGQTRRYQR